MVEPMKFGPEQDIWSPYTRNLPLLLRKMSKYPEETRVFNQAPNSTGCGNTRSTPNDPNSTSHDTRLLPRYQ